MKAFVACAFLASSAALFAQVAAPAGQMPATKMAISTDEDHSKTMKDIQAQNGALRKALAAPAEGDAVAAASKLEADLKDVQAYWEAKKVDDATTAAKNAVAASEGISKALAAHDLAAANAALPTLGATCTACHTAHRERQPDGTFKMK